MAKCDKCGKGPQFGHNVSHSERKTNRRYDPNIKRVRITIDGKLRRMHVCTRCLRTMMNKSV
jgi:large subunit ribosomal protein L28